MDKMTLGQTLKSARDLQLFTLRQVEDATGISNAYLSQLENDKIKKPSANVLYKLSSLYKISLDALLFAAGIIKEQQGVTGAVAGLPGAGKLTPEEEKKLLLYLHFLRYKSKPRPIPKNQS